MRINKIELYNIGPYEGLNKFDISGQCSTGKITVIGGKNGAGKTTLFSGIKLCLYGHKKEGYQAINSWYKRSIKKLINDKAKLENNAFAYTLLDLSIFSGQDWDNYILKRQWNMDKDPFEQFTVIRNNVELSVDEIDDFDNFLLNMIPPELFDLYFFDGEQIADYFLEESNDHKIKNAFLTICGYEVFDILYKNFKRISKNSDVNNTALEEFFKAEENLRIAENKLKVCNENILALTNEIEQIKTLLAGKEKQFTSRGGVSVEEWNNKFLELKKEECIREEKNAWLKDAANEIIPYLILKKQIFLLQSQIMFEEENSKQRLLGEALQNLIPKALAKAKKDIPVLTDEINEKIINILLKTVCVGENIDDSILNLSKDEYHKLARDIAVILSYDSQNVVQAKKEIKESIKRSREIRDDIETSNIQEVDCYLREKEELLEKKDNSLEKLRLYYDEQKELTALVKKLDDAYKLAEKELDKHFKGESITALTTKSILFLDILKKRLFENEIGKVEKLFMKKINQLMRKEKFISDISIDDEFNVHVFKQIRVDSRGICEKIKQSSIDDYINEYGVVHCDDILKATNCSNLEEFVKTYETSQDIIEVLVEFDKSTMSNGEKQVFIMSLYWAIMQLCNKEIPFLIDTPFARIDTTHRAHITEHFFKELKGQVLIFSTDEEITPEYMTVIGNDLQSKFLIENIDNKKTHIMVNKYFGE